MGSIQLKAEISDAAVPAVLTIASGDTGLAPLVAVRDPGTASSYLDFNDNTFKTVGWTTRQAAMTEVSAANSPGRYEQVLAVSAWVGLTANSNHVELEYVVTIAARTFQETDTLLLVNHEYDVAIATDIISDATPFQGADVAAILVDTGTTLPAEHALLETEAAAATREATNTTEHGTTLTAVGLNESEVSAATRETTNTAEHATTVVAVGAVETDTQDIQSRLPATLVTGRMDSDVGAMQAGTITPAAVATDAIDADALAADAVVEIQTGLATAASVALLETEAAAATREATNTTEHAATQTDISNLNDPTPAQIDAQLTAAHGAGPWTTGAGSSPAVVAAAVWDALTAAHVAPGSFGLDAQDHAQSAEIAALNDLSIVDVLAALDTQGYTAVRSALLDNLDAAVSLVRDHAKAANVQTQPEP